MAKPVKDPYKVLEIEKGASEKEIKKAYRLQCLKWHPDKNLDNKDEAERKFNEVKEAFNFLFDKEKRSEYDRGKESERVAEERKRERMEKADGERKKKIEELERREKEFLDRNKRPAENAPMSMAQELKKRKVQESRIRDEIEEIRKQLEKEANEEVKRQMERMKTAQDTHSSVVDETVTPKLIVKWKPEKDEDYDEEALKIIFEPYGRIANVSPALTVKKGKKKCLIEFEMGTNAWGAELETGVSPGPEITAEWLNPPVDVKKREEEKQKKAQEKQNLEAMSLEDLEAQILGGF